MLKYVLLIAIGAGAAWHFKPAPVPPAPPPPPAPALVSVQEMGHLASLRMNYSNIIEFDHRVKQDIPFTNWELRFGGTKVVLMARGDCVVGTDLRAAKYEAVDDVARTATLMLAQPKPISARLNHEKPNGSYFYAVTSSGVEPLSPSSDSRQKAIDSALARAQEDITRACNATDIIAATRINAEAVLKPTLSATGWKINLVWR